MTLVTEKSIAFQQTSNKEISKERLDTLHRAVPVDYYERGVKTSLLQRFWHARRFHEVERLLRDMNGPYLDLGCHSGHMTHHVSTLLHSPAVGVDISSDAILHARSKYPNDTWIAADLFHGIPQPDRAFRVVTAFDVLEHLLDPEAFMREVARVLQPQGLFLCTIPREHLLFQAGWKWWTTWRGAAWQDVHIQEFDPPAIHTLLLSAGFEIRVYRQTMLGMYQYYLCQKR